MHDTTQVKQSRSGVVVVAQHGLRAAAESIGISYAMCVGPTLYETARPLVESIGKLGFEKGWAEGTKTGWMAAPAGMIGSGMMGRIAANMTAAFMEAAYGRKLTGNEKTACEAAGAFVAVGLQVGVFSGAGLAALLTPAAGVALAYYAVAGAVTNLAVFAVEKPLKSIANYAGKIFTSAPPAPA